MCYAEASYFDGYHFQHIAAYYEVKRIAAINKRVDKYFARNKRKYR